MITLAGCTSKENAMQLCRLVYYSKYNIHAQSGVANVLSRYSPPQFV